MADTNEYDHTELDFSNLDRGDDWFLKHRDDFVPTLHTLLKRIDPNGTEFNPETLNASEVESETLKATDNSDVTINVPTDYATISDALLDLGKFTFPDDVNIEINCESGHEIQTAIELQDGDWSNFIIRSADAELPVSSNVTAGNIIHLVKAHGPVIDTTININSLTDGVLLDKGSKMTLASGNGVLNATTTCVLVRQSWFRGEDCTYSGAEQRGLQVDAGRASAPGSTFEDITGGDTHGLGVRLRNGAVAHVRGSVARNCDWHGFSADASWMSAQNVEVYNTGRDGILATNAAKVIARNSLVDGTDLGGYYARRGSVILAQNTEIYNVVEFGGKVRMGGMVFLTFAQGDDSIGGYNHDVGDFIEIDPNQWSKAGYASTSGGKEAGDPDLTPPAGGRYFLSANQTITGGTLEDVQWDVEELRGDTESMLSSTGVIRTPSWADHARVSVNILFADPVEVDVFRLQADGASIDGGELSAADTLYTGEAFNFTSSWINIDSFTDYTFNLRAGSGTDIRSDQNRTWLDIELE